MAELNTGALLDFAGVLDSGRENKGGARVAVVARIGADGTVYVSLPGGVDETPIATSGASLNIGDVVNVSIEGGKLRAIANITDPSASSAELRSTARTANNANTTAINAAETAREADRLANATNQHFWSDDSGVHVTEAENDATTEHNILINSLGILLRKATNYLVSLTQSAIAFYDGLGNAAGNIVAKFGADGAQIGSEDSGHISMLSDEMALVNEDGVKWFDVDLNAGSTHGRYEFLAASATRFDDFDAKVFDGNVSNYQLSSNGYSLSGLPSGASVDIDAQVGMYTYGRPDFVEYHAELNADEAVLSDSGISILAVPGGGSTFELSVEGGIISVTAGTSSTWTYTASNVKVIADGTDVASGVTDGDVLGVLSVTMTLAYDGSTNAITCSGTATVTSFTAAFEIESFTAFRGTYTISTTGAAMTFGERKQNSGIGILSSAFGHDVTASGKYAFAEGDGATASGQASHAGGTGTKATRNSQTAIGKYNKNDTNNTYAVIIGNGTADNARSNALTADWSGSAQLWHPDIERGTAPSSSIYGGGGTLQLVDKDGHQIGYLQPMQLSDGTEGIQLGVSNSDSTDYNTLQLAFDSSDNPTVSVSDADKWRNALGITDSGWKTLTLGSAAKAYDSGTAPVYRKCFNVVNIVGAVSPKSQVAAGGEFDVGVLPTGYRPKVAASTVCQGSGNSVYLLRIGTNGNIRVERYRNGASVNAAISTTTWLPFNVTFICA